MQADVPRIEIVQACQCLGLYWWAIGERERTHILSRKSLSTLAFVILTISSFQRMPTLMLASWAYMSSQMTQITFRTKSGDVCSGHAG
jgi:hypothetical protein